MPETDTIQVLGRGTNVDFAIDDSVPFELAERRLREYLSECRGLYSRGTVTVNVGRRILAADQMDAIKSILGRETGLTVSCYWCPPDVLSRALAGPECRRALPSPAADGAGDNVDDLSIAAVCQPADAPVRPGDTAGKEETSSADTRELGRPVGQQLSMLFPELFPDLDGEQSGEVGRRKAGPQPGGNRPGTPPAANLEVFHQFGPEPSVAAGAGKAPEGEPVAGVVDPAEEAVSDQGASRLGQAEEGGSDVVHTVFQSVLSRGGEALIIKNTCRSGEVVEYPGDVVVFGDVNPGAEIVAGGDVLVLGALRGTAHAGAKGNLKAIIFALNMESHRLQIGPHAGERPREARKGKGGGRAVNPQIAYLRRGSIFVAPFERRCEEYRGGVPYEG